MAAKTKADVNEVSAPENENNNVNIDSKAEKKVNKKKDKKKGKKKGKGKIIFLIILLLIVGAAVAVFGFNVFNLRDEYVYPVLREVPVVKDWIPEDENAEKDEYSDLTREQLIVQNKKLASEKKALEEDKKSLTDKISENNKEITRLKEFEANQTKFQKQSN